METYDKIFAEGYDQIIYICISSKFSGTIQNARLAAEDYTGKVLIHDSLNLSTGIGLQVMKAVNWVKEGKTGEEVLALLEELAPRVRAQFAVESLDYLYKGGRCSQTSYFFGKGLKIKPIIKVVDGGMIVYKKPIGKMVNALNKLLEIFKEDLDNVELNEALEEVRNGNKEGHWIWYIFPQMAGLGHSHNSNYYGIKSLLEAKAYLEEETLRKRLYEITNALYNQDCSDPESIFGGIDAMKVCSCMTLFDYLSPNDIFGEVLDVFYNGDRGGRTLRVIDQQKSKEK